LLVTGVIAALVIVYLFFLAPAFVVIGGQNATSAILSSYKSVKKNKAVTLLFAVMSPVIFVIINLIGAAPIFLYSLTGPFAVASLDQETLLLFGLFQIFLTTYATLFLYSALANFYSELKGRKIEKEKKVVKRRKSHKRKRK
jgi:hypothetical protein